MTFNVPEMYRVTKGRMGSDKTVGNNGAFYVPMIRTPVVLAVIASCGEGWEHVSVSLSDRCPTWAEMCRVKELFWGPEDCVVQFHPAKSEYVNVHPNCLHLWRREGTNWETPPMWMIG